jgi:hypothetical protein
MSPTDAKNLGSSCEKGSELQDFGDSISLLEMDSRVAGMDALASPTVLELSSE